MLLMFVVVGVTVNTSFVTTVCRLLCSGCWAGYESHGDFDLNIFVTEITRFFFFSSPLTPYTLHPSIPLMYLLEANVHILAMVSIAHARTHTLYFIVLQMCSGSQSIEANLSSVLLVCLSRTVCRYILSPLPCSDFLVLHTFGTLVIQITQLSLQNLTEIDQEKAIQ